MIFFSKLLSFSQFRPFSLTFQPKLSRNLNLQKNWIVFVPGVVHERNAECDEEQVEEVVVAGGHDRDHQKNLEATEQNITCY